MKKKICPELIAPAGDLEKLKVAFHFGADAVYAGMVNYSLRANNKNFDVTQISDAIYYAHQLKKKIYIALNIYFTPFQIEGLIDYLKLVEELKPDGIILSDLGAVYLAKQYAPSIPIHLSTQANTTNQFAVKQYQEIGIKRIILARELNLNDINQINKETSCSLEAFVHGAMCIAYSGRCLLSAYMTHPGLGRRNEDHDVKIRSANQGDCAHACRWEYTLKENMRPDQEFIYRQDIEGAYVFSSKDMCMIDYVNDLVQAGIMSFKIEGRMKSILYISSIIRAYRQAIDHWYNPGLEYNRELIQQELDIVSHREFCTGFYFDDPRKTAYTTGGGMYQRKIRLAALIIGVNNNRAVLKIYNTLTDQHRFEYIAPQMNTIKLGKIVFRNKNNQIVNKINHNDYAEAELWDNTGQPISPEPLNILRMEAEF